MNTIMKAALGAVMLGGAALAGTAPANAAVVGVTIGVPGVAVGYNTDLCYGPIALQPAWCFAPAYYGPQYYSAGWYAPYRVYGGRDVVVRDRIVPEHAVVRDRDDFRDRDGRMAVEHRVVR